MANFKHRVGFHMCPGPGCGRLLDGVTAITQEGDDEDIVIGRAVLPEDGNLSVCVYCGTVLVFDSKSFGGMRIATEDEINELPEMARTVLLAAHDQFGKKPDLN